MEKDPLKKNYDPLYIKEELLSTVLSIVLNIISAAGKIVCGVIFGAVSVLADGFNNLSDCGGNIITLIGVKFSSMPADREHPFGHARGEYIVPMALSFLIILLGFELFTSSVDSLIEGSKLTFSYITVAVLAVSVAVKLFMFFFNRHLSVKLGSDTLSATAIDSLGDALSSLVVLASLLIMRFTSVALDGYAGCVISVVIFVSGIRVLRSAVGKQLGKRPSKEVLSEITRRLLSYEGVYGIHSLTVHDYVSKLYAYVHIEVDADVPFLASHELADKIENDFAASTDVLLTVHLDPIIMNDPLTVKLRTQITDELGASLSFPFAIHDFRLVRCSPMRIVFEVSVPNECSLSDDKIKSDIVENLYASFGTEYDYFVSVRREITA